MANIQSCTPKATRCVRSRYFVVREETMIPNPRARSAICRTRSGTRRTLQPVHRVRPCDRNHPIMIRKRANWIPKVTRLLITTDNGTARRGNQTLPKRLALDTKVSDVFEMQLAK